MKLRKMSVIEFDEFAKQHPLSSYHQTSNYAIFMAEQGYDYDLLCLEDNESNIVAASLILIKKINFFYKYGYAPKGFLLDYNNPSIIKEFTKALTKYYYNKNVAFIKTNPEIQIGQMDFKNKMINYNRNRSIIGTLEGLNFRTLESNKYFETKLPKYNAVLILKNTNYSTFDKNIRNKINKSLRNGMTLVKGNREDIKTLYKFIEKKKESPLSHYINYYNAFSRNDSIDVFLVKINFEDCLINLREKYEEESSRNEKYIRKLMENNSKENLENKLNSDKILNNFHESISKATRCLADEKEQYIAGAIVIKHKNRVNILISGYDLKFKTYCPNHFLHYALIEYYKKDYDFMDLNGITGEFGRDNPYKGLNDFKMGFKPLAFEYIGEFDYIINKGLYVNLEQNGLLAKEFNKKTKSTNN